MNGNKYIKNANEVLSELGEAPFTIQYESSGRN